MKSTKEYNYCTMYLHYSEFLYEDDEEKAQKWQPNKRKEMNGKKNEK